MSRESVVMLHGFGGTARAFDGVVAALAAERYTPLPLDLPGHGANAHQGEPIAWESCVAGVLAAAPASFALCGYSMGGRIALGVALAAPRQVSRLLLVSATAGIDDEAERASRREADESLATEIEGGSLERFIERWRAQPLFADEPSQARALAVADHRRNSTAGLAAALRGAGAGAMPSLWGRLHELTMPVVALAGERDDRYWKLGAKIVAAVPDGELRIVSGGHSLLLENPAAVASAIEGAR